MMYPYMTFDDGTVVVHSQLLGDADHPMVEVHLSVRAILASALRVASFLRTRGHSGRAASQTRR